MTRLTGTLLATTMVMVSAWNVNAGETLTYWPPETLLSTRSIADVQISPDNQSLLFVVNEAKENGNDLIKITRIYQVNDIQKGMATPLINSDKSIACPRWSPDGKWILYLAEYQGTKNLHLMDSSGADVRVLTNCTNDVQTYSWSPDGTKIALVTPEEVNDVVEDVKNHSMVVFGEKRKVNRLWVLDPFASECNMRPLTGDGYQVKGNGDFGAVHSEFDWSPDSKKIVFTYTTGVGFDFYHLEGSLAVVDLETGEVVPWKKMARYEGLPRYSPDGRFVAHLSDDTKEAYAINRRIALRSCEDTSYMLLAPTYNEAALIKGQSLLGWTSEGNNILFWEPKGTKFSLVQLPIDGSEAQEIETGSHFFTAPVLSRDGTTVAFIGQKCDQPPEVYVTPLDEFSPMCASHLNDSLLSLPMPMTESVQWQSADGWQIEGLLTYPLGYQPGKRYPLALVVHGGPMFFFDETFLGAYYPYPIASFAEAGYVVFRPNPRGSTGYGKEFRCANYGDWGGMDYQDIMSGVDALIEAGIVDESRMGVMGWSYGGYMTAWMITQTSRFAASSAGGGLYNMASFFGTTDIPRLTTDYLGELTSNFRLYTERSPLYWVVNATTPCLIQHGIEDKRVPVSQAYELYRALKEVQVDVKLKLYSGMPHSFTDPKMQLDCMQSNLDWFQKYLAPF